MLPLLDLVVRLLCICVYCFDLLMDMRYVLFFYCFDMMKTKISTSPMI